MNVALILYVAFWATGVQHRRRSHRFPVSLEAAWAPDDGGLPSLAGHIDDLGRYGARLVVDWPRDRGERVRLVMLLDDGPVEVTGRVATVKRIRGTESYRVGVAFDPMDAAMADAIVASCFRNPFGPDRPRDPGPRAGVCTALRPAASRRSPRPSSPPRRPHPPPRPPPTRRPAPRRRRPRLRWTHRDVAQPGSAPPLGGGGPRFESGRPDTRPPCGGRVSGDLRARRFAPVPDTPDTWMRIGAASI